MLALALGLSPLLAFAPVGGDARLNYDVDAYELDLRVDPATRTLSGTVIVRATVTAESLDDLVLDLQPPFEVTSVRTADGSALSSTREERLLHCRLPEPKPRGALVAIAVAYTGKPVARDDFTGFHWKNTADGKPWISTSCQDTGASSWWPCKDSYFHPEDKPARVAMDVTVPPGLIAVSNGKLASRNVNADGTETFHWRHPYPLETYSVTLDVAPYVALERDVKLEGLEKPLHTVFYALPEHVERAQKTFDEVPAMLAAYSKAFGPFPFPESKYALVETPFWGMEHSTAVAYGSSFPAWLKENGGKDRYADRNKRFDYILVHESAHEWWGNAVSALHWGDFWLHEGFATYAEAVYLEIVRGPDEAQAHMDTWKSSVGAHAQLFRGDNVDSGQAYGLVLYAKGAWVLHTLRQYVADDERWWRTLREFQAQFRYKNATTEDFRAVLEHVTGHDWKRFFDEWVRGHGQPRITGKVSVRDSGLTFQIEVGKTAETDFHVPLDISWTQNGGTCTRRLELAPGANNFEIVTTRPPSEVRIVGLERILGHHDVKVENASGG